MRLKTPLFTLLVTGAALLASHSAQATPAFARQMNTNCMTCHNQSIPMLNAFGRQFKLSGYTLTAGDKSMITSGDLGQKTPVAINAGIGIKANNLTTTQKDATGNTKRGTLAIPAGGSIMIGGQVGENMGANTLWNSDGIIHLQATYSKPISSGHVGVSMFGTQGHGSFIAIEGHNTGLHKELAMFDNSARTNAVQAMGLGLGKGPASGLVAFYGGNGLKLAVGMRALGFNSTFNNGGMDTDGADGTLYRVTYDVPAMAGWNLSVGAFGIAGTTTGTSSVLFENIPVPFAAAPWFGNVNNHEITSNGFDLQLQGRLAGFDTQFLYTSVGSYEMQIRNLTDTMTMAKADYAANSFELQVMANSAWGFRLGQMDFTDNLASAKDYKTTSVGVNYNYADNIRVSLEQCNVDLAPSAAKDYTETLLTTIVAF